MNRNFEISGWPGAGASALSILITINFGYTLLRGTETFRELGRRLNKKNTGADRIEIDNYLEPIFGPVFDEYIDHKLLNDEKILVEADIGAFRIGKNEKIYSIFLYAEQDERTNRLTVDGRQEDIDHLHEREQELRQRYLELHNIDWFDLDLIREKHDLVLDNTNLSIEDELKSIYSDMFNKKLIDKEEYSKLINSAKNDTEKYWKVGKSTLLDELKNKQQLMDAPEVLDEIKEIFPHEIDKFPDELKEVI